MVICTMGKRLIQDCVNVKLHGYQYFTYLFLERVSHYVVESIIPALYHLSIMLTLKGSFTAVGMPQYHAHQ